MVNQIQNINGEWPGISNTGCLLNSYIWRDFIDRWGFRLSLLLDKYFKKTRRKNEKNLSFTYKNKNYTDVDFFEQIFKDDWDVFDQQKKLSLFEDYLKKELSVLACQKHGVDLIPSTQIKLQEKFKKSYFNTSL